MPDSWTIISAKELADELELLSKMAPKAGALREAIRRFRRLAEADTPTDPREMPITIRPTRTIGGLIGQALDSGLYGRTHSETLETLASIGIRRGVQEGVLKVEGGEAEGGDDA